MINLNEDININEIGKPTKNMPIIKCPNCGTEHEHLLGGYTINMDDLNGRFKHMDVEKAKKCIAEHGSFFPCIKCGYVFSGDKEEDALRCPLCEYGQLDILDYGSFVSCMCPKCNTCLKYTGWPTFWLNALQLMPTDNPTGIWPYCAPYAEEHNAMLRGDEIMASNRILKIPIACESCGYRGQAKIDLINRSAIPNVISE